MKLAFIRQGSTTLAVAVFSLIGFASATTTGVPTTKYLAGVPINTFCSTYAKNEATKSVALGLIVKIKENPLQKAALMRQYATFISLGKQFCKGEYAPSLYGFQSVDTTPPPATPTSPTNIDISHNTPIIETTTAHYTTQDDYFTGYDTSLLAGLTSDQLSTTYLRIAQAKDVYGKIMDELIGQGFLQPADKDEMVGKVAFTFSNNCNQLDGKILVRYRSDINNKFVKSELVNMLITINLCFSDNYQTNFETFLDRIIYHELGHFYDYFHDANSDSGFRDICRSGKEDICNGTDFVSTYAPTSPDEDYAETFSYYEQMKGAYPPLTTKLQQKLDYFKMKDPRYQ